jgi:CHASE3 domain sensor protein
MSRTLAVWFVVALIILLTDAVFSYRALRTIGLNEQKVAHTHEVLLTLENTFSTLKDAETGQRGYLLTGHEDYLEPYHAATARVSTSLTHLRELFADDPNQQRLFSLLEPAVHAKLSELDETIELRQHKRSEAAQQVVLTNRGKLLMDDIRQKITAMQAAEQEARQHRLAELQASAQQAKLTLFIISLLTVATLALLYVQVTRNMVERARLLTDERAAYARAEAARQTEQQARAEAERASSLKDEFLATVSHELRTPLTALLGWARMIRDGQLDAATETRALEAIERNARSQAQLIEDLLDVSRIVAGRLRLDVRQVELPAVIEAALDAVRPAAAAK